VVSNHSFCVLLIEDDADTRANLRDILELDDYQVEVSESLAAAYARGDWPHIGAVLLDRRLPDGTAEEALPRIKELAPDAAVFIVTGHGDLESAMRAIHFGAAEYILKPVNPEHLRASLSRIVRLREAEDRARRAERLATIGEMIAGLAHESRNALQRIGACAENLELEVQDRPEARELVARILKAQEHLHKLFDEVRTYAAPVQLDLERHSLSSIWREAWALLEAHRRGRDVRLAESTGGLDLHCRVDRFRLTQVFRNVLENALAACQDPVEIEIACRQTRLANGTAIEVSVRDNGPGLDPQQLLRIFEPFYTTKPKGTGLGMSIAQRIIEAHGGRIAAQNASRGGAELVITVPQ
jgi:signal transduction histidine kinase